MHLRYLPIADGTHITRPLATLKDITGYTMTLLSDMISFEKAFTQMPEEIKSNDWIDNAFGGPGLEPQKQLFQMYYSTGGSRRRLQAFFKVANIFAQLHENGLIVSSIVDEKAPEVWIIDADNIDYISVEPAGYYTQLSCAPEASQGEFSFASDAYAFAVLLFKHLTIQHPFMGREYEDWDEFDGPSEVEIAAGNLAWIWDEEDDTNSRSPFFPPELYLNDEMLDFFARTFSADGRQKPAKRPSMPEWSRALARLLDHTVVCPNCGMGYDASSHDCCSWCDAVSPVIIVQCRRNSDRSNGPVWDFRHEIKVGQTVHVPRRAIGGFVQDEGDAFQVELKPGKLRFSEFCTTNQFAFVNCGVAQTISGELEIQTGDQRFIVKDLRDGMLAEIEVKIENES